MKLLATNVPGNFPINQLHHIIHLYFYFENKMLDFIDSMSGADINYKIIIKKEC